MRLVASASEDYQLVLVKRYIVTAQRVMKTISIWFWLFTALFTISVNALSQTIKSNNDSAQFYLEIGQTKKAYSFIQKNLESTSNSGPEFIRLYLLVAQIHETEGYVLEALTNFRNATRLAKRSANNILLAAAWRGVARSLVALDQSDSVLWYCDESLKLDTGFKNKIENNLTKVHYWKNTGQNDKAMQYCQAVYDLAKSSGDKKSLGLILSEMGSIYFNQYSDMKQALNFYRLALNEFDSSKHATLIAHTYTRMANALMVQEKGKEALEREQSEDQGRGHRVGEVRDQLGPSMRQKLLSQEAHVIEDEGIGAD